MINLIDDVSTLTDVSTKVLSKFVPVCNRSIGHAVHEGLCNKEDIVEIDIGIGNLLIKTDSESIQYRFIPSKDLEKVLIQTVSTNSSPIVDKLDSNLQEKIDRAYKELL